MVSVNWIHIWTTGKAVLDNWPTIAMSVGVFVLTLFSIYAVWDDFKEKARERKEERQAIRDLPYQTGKMVYEALRGSPRRIALDSFYGRQIYEDIKKKRSLDKIND